MCQGHPGPSTIEMAGPKIKFKNEHDVKEGSYTTDLWTYYLASRAFGRFFRPIIDNVHCQRQKHSHSIQSTHGRKSQQWSKHIADRPADTLCNQSLSSYDPTVSLEMSTGKLCCHLSCLTSQLQMHRRKAGTALPSDFCGSKGSRSSFALKL